MRTLSVSGLSLRTVVRKPIGLWKEEAAPAQDKCLLTTTLFDMYIHTHTHKHRHMGLYTYILYGRSPCGCCLNQSMVSSCSCLMMKSQSMIISDSVVNVGKTRPLAMLALQSSTALLLNLPSAAHPMCSCRFSVFPISENTFIETRSSRLRIVNRCGSVAASVVRLAQRCLR